MAPAKDDTQIHEAFHISERGYMYTYGWLMLRFDMKQQNSVKQLSFNKKLIKKKKKRICLQFRRPRFNCWVGKIPWRREWLTWLSNWHTFDNINQMGFPHSSVDKESACNSGDPGSIPGSGRSPGEGNGNPLQHSCLENPMDRGAW